MTYYDEHRTERMEYQRQYNSENREKYIQYQRKYYSDVLKARRAYAKAVPPVLKAFPVSNSILYEKRINTKFDVTFD